MVLGLPLLPSATAAEPTETVLGGVPSVQMLAWLVNAPIRTLPFGKSRRDDPQGSGWATPGGPLHSPSRMPLRNTEIDAALAPPVPEGSSSKLNASGFCDVASGAVIRTTWLRRL